MENNEICKIEEILEKMVKDYTKMALKEGSNQVKLKSSLEEGLSKVEAFVDVADMMRKSSTELMEGPVERLSESIKVMHQYFESIDKLETFVGIVGKQVGELEDRLATIEEEKKKDKKKYNIPFLSNKTQSSRRKSYEPIEIFNADLYFIHSSSSPKFKSSSTTPQSSTSHTLEAPLMPEAVHLPSSSNTLTSTTDQKLK